MYDTCSGRVHCSSKTAGAQVPVLQHAGPDHGATVEPRKLSLSSEPFGAARLASLHSRKLLKVATAHGPGGLVKLVSATEVSPGRC